MATAEENVKAIIRRFESETLERISKAGSEGQAQVLRFVEEYIASLQVEMPLSVKQVLDHGGQVRQVKIVPQRGQEGIYDLRIQVSGRYHSEGYTDTEGKEIVLDFSPTHNKGLRVTMIIDPIQ